MRVRGTKDLLAATMVLVLAGPGQSSQRPYRMGEGAGEFCYGHVSYVDLRLDGKDPVILREGIRPEPARLNSPLCPGDVLRTFEGRRLEARFDDGALIRFDGDTELRIETILARSLSSRRQVTNLLLEQGRILAIYEPFLGPEIFQVITPVAAVKLNGGTAAIIAYEAKEGASVLVRSGRAKLLIELEILTLYERDVTKDRRMLVDRAGRYFAGEAPGPSDLELWSEGLTADLESLCAGKRRPPGAVRRINPAVFEFARTLGRAYGEWLSDPGYGRAWRPFDNDGGRDKEWRPFGRGAWIELGGGPFWIPDEPWGWIPYHLGAWRQDPRRGWVWIPGPEFASARPSWSFGFCGFGWIPFAVWDWMGWVDASRWGFEGFFEEESLIEEQDNDGLAATSSGGRRAKLLTRITKDQLKALDASIRRAAAPAGIRYRDWNPDAALARELGVSILYASQANEIRCPEKGISSSLARRGIELKRPRRIPVLGYEPAYVSSAMSNSLLSDPYAGTASSVSGGAEAGSVVSAASSTGVSSGSLAGGVKKK